MRRKVLAVAVLLLTMVAVLHAGTTITPTTTLTAETSNNTSAADTFQTQSNGNLGASNISKVDTRTLLYAGATTTIYAHLMPWFGQSSHMNVGYSSNDPAQVHRQVDDMLSRGITGAIVDWYGPNKTWNNTTTLLLMQEAETRNGQFTFAAMEDKGALQACANTSGCSVTQQLISDLTYAYNTFEVSPAYARINGRPLVFFFDVDRYTIDWPTVVASIPGNPLLIFRNSGGFTHAYSSGSFGWVGFPDSISDWGQTYVDNFYTTALKYPLEHTFGTGYKGFNDTLASWGKNRIVNQDCGQTWLHTFNEIGRFYSGAGQLESLQLVTWNDYEEGTEIESGIDNCVTVSGSMTGNTLNWNIAGQENTIDHYTVFISLDGQNLMPVTDIPAGTHSLDLTSYDFAAANYTIYVKAVGKPSVKNQMSPAISYIVGAPTVAVNVTPASGTVPLMVTATLSASDPDGDSLSTQINFGDGTVVSGTSATHSYTTAGSYTVTATATDPGNLSATATATVTANPDLPPQPMLAVTPASGTAPLAVTASMAGTTDSDGTVASYSIDFGDGTVAKAYSASHTYSAAGTYTVKGTATDNAGLSATTSATVTVAAPVPYVVAVKSPINGATVGSPVHFVASTTSPYPVTGMKIYVDSVGVYTTSAATIDTLLPISPGTHAVTIKAWNTTGAIASQKLSISVTNQPPVVSLAVTPTSGTAPLSVKATVSASDSTGISSTSINFGDGSIVSGASAAHTYSAAGTYTVTATVTDNAGLTAKATATVSVTAPIVARAVKITSPVSGGTYSSPVHIVASATSPYPVTALKVYVDSVARYTVNAASLNTYLSMTSGTHNITVNAWDSTGAVWKSSVNIAVK